MRYTVDEIKEIVSALAAQYGADWIYLFGSYARGDADKNSDIALSKMCMELRGCRQKQRYCAI